MYFNEVLKYILVIAQMDHNSIHFFTNHLQMAGSKVLGGRSRVPRSSLGIVHSSPESPRMYQDTLHSIPRNGGDLVGKPLYRKGEKLSHNYKSSVHKDEGWSWWWLWVDQLAWVQVV